MTSIMLYGISRNIPCDHCRDSMVSTAALVLQVNVVILDPLEKQEIPVLLVPPASLDLLEYKVLVDQG